VIHRYLAAIIVLAGVGFMVAATSGHETVAAFLGAAIVTAALASLIMRE
jgi:hypothetical protein